LLPVGSKTLTIVTSEPFDKELVGKIAADMGEITLSGDSGTRGDNKGGAPDSGPHVGVSVNTETKNRSGIVIRDDKSGTTEELHPTFTVGTVPAAAGSMDREVTFFAPLPVLDWKTG
jgi:hypothetical protein